jgi:hypothetical protein
VASGAAVALVMGTHLLDFEVYDLRIRFLDAGSAWSFSHVAAGGALGICAWLCGTAAVLGAPRRRSWCLAGGAFALMFADAATRLHDHLGPWPLLYAPLLLTLFVAIVLVGRGTAQAGAIWTALALLLGSLAIHVFGHAAVAVLGWSEESLATQIKVGLKEGTELAGWVVLVPALARLAATR